MEIRGNVELNLVALAILSVLLVISLYHLMHPEYEFILVGDFVSALKFYLLAILFLFILLFENLPFDLIVEMRDGNSFVFSNLNFFEARDLRDLISGNRVVSASALEKHEDLKGFCINRKKADEDMPWVLHGSNLDLVALPNVYGFAILLAVLYFFIYPLIKSVDFLEYIGIFSAFLVPAVYLLWSKVLCGRLFHKFTLVFVGNEYRTVDGGIKREGPRIRFESLWFLDPVLRLGTRRRYWDEQSRKAIERVSSPEDNTASAALSSEHDSSGIKETKENLPLEIKSEVARDDLDKGRVGFGRLDSCGGIGSGYAPRNEESVKKDRVGTLSASVRQETRSQSCDNVLEEHDTDLRRGGSTDIVSPTSLLTDKIGFSLEGRRAFLWGAPRDGAIAEKLRQHGARVMAGIGKTTDMVILIEDEATPKMKSSANWRRIEARKSEGNEIELITLETLQKYIDLR